MTAFDRLSCICGPQVPPELLAELAAHRAEVLNEAIEAARAEHLKEDTGTPEDEAYNQGVDDAVAAIGALLEATPAAVSVPVKAAGAETGEAKTYPPSSFGAVIYKALDSFQRANRLPGLRHAQIRSHLTEHLVDAFAADAAKLLAEVDGRCPAEYGGPGYTHCELTAGHDGQHESAIGNMHRATWGGDR